MRKAIQFRKLDEVQRISGELVASLGTEGPDQVTIMVAEMIKLASFQALEKGDVATKGIKELSQALQAAVNAQRASGEHRRKTQEEVDQRLKKAADQVAELGKKGGVSDETLAEINRVLGVG